MKYRFNDGRDWFFEKRFGMFIHWGLYSIDAWHEQMQYRKKMSRAEYTPLMNKFNPTEFDPDKWLDLAEEAGMQYICFTTKHIDGFCLFETKHTDYNIMNTPYGKDTLKMITDACHRRGFPICLYYSVIDMHQPNYPNQGRSYELPAPEEGDEPDLGKHIEFIKNQIKELCTNYGNISGFWWDGGHIPNHHDASVNNLIRSLQPNCIINNRGFDEGDFGTPERDWYSFVNNDLSFDMPVESCQSVGYESWGFRENEDFYSDRYFMESIDKVHAKGGNYLLNVGPNALGTITEAYAQILRTIGKWYKKVQISFEDTEPYSQLTVNRDVLLTKKGNKIYVHLYKIPNTRCVWLKPIDVKPIKAVLLNNDKEVEACVELTPSSEPMLRLRELPVNEFANSVLVVELEFEEIPQIKEYTENVYQL
jgi:alpha-L-fucosidase